MTDTDKELLDAYVVEKVAAARQDERNVTMTAIQIMLEMDSGAAVNAIVGDYPELREWIAEHDKRRVAAAVEARDELWICSIAKVLGAFCLSSGDIEGSVQKYIEAGKADAVEAAMGELREENERLREVLRACDSILTAQGYPNNAAHAALKGKS